jgi:hypothetical protein
MTPITIPNHPAPMYVSAPTYAIPAKLVRDTIYMPSSVAARVLGAMVPEKGERETERATRGA